MDTLVERLKIEFSDRKTYNSSYSLRAFARDLKVNVTSLSLILANKRRPSLKFRKAIVDRLSFSPSLIGVPDSLQGSSKRLEDDEFRIIAEWYHLAILNLLRPGAGPYTIAELAERLALSQVVIEAAIGRLHRLGFVEKKEDEYFRKVGSVQTSEDIPSRAIRRFHKDILDLAKEALVDVPVSAREFSSSFIMVNPAKIPKIKELVRKFRSEFFQIFDPSEKAPSQAQLYVLSTQFFPIEEEESHEN